MVVKVKEKLEKARHVKNNVKSEKMLYEDKEMQDIVIEFYLIKKNLLISRLSSVQKTSRLLNSIKFKTKYSYSYKSMYTQVQLYVHKHIHLVFKLNRDKYLWRNHIKLCGNHHASTHISEKSSFRLRQKSWSTGQLSCLSFQLSIE